jgi:hypothetical protein
LVAATQDRIAAPASSPPRLARCAAVARTWLLVNTPLASVPPQSMREWQPETSHLPHPKLTFNRDARSVSTGSSGSDLTALTSNTERRRACTFRDLPPEAHANKCARIWNATAFACFGHPKAERDSDVGHAPVRHKREPPARRLRSPSQSSFPTTGDVPVVALTRTGD